MKLKWNLVGMLLWLGLLAQLAEARIVSETWRWDFTPTLEEITRWERVPGRRIYHFKLIDFDQSKARELLHLTSSAILFRLEFDVLPDEDRVYSGLRHLAESKIPMEFIGNFRALPTHPRWDDLLSSGFQSFKFVLDHFPFSFEADILNAFSENKLTVAFETRAYPKYEEIDLLNALKPSILLEFQQDYWPLYPQVDALKLTAHPKVIHAKDMVPQEPTFSYLKTMPSLREIVADAMFFPSERSFWGQFGSMSVQWVHRDHFLDEEGFSAFEQTAILGPRKVRVDLDNVLTPQERSRYESSPLEIQILQSAP